MGAPSLGDCDGGDHQLSLECLKLSKLRTGFSCNSKATLSHTINRGRVQTIILKQVTSATHVTLLSGTDLSTVMNNYKLYFVNILQEMSVLSDFQILNFYYPHT